MMKVPGNNYEFTQPIQMRFNELISGVRSDVAVKVFGDDMDTLNETAEQISKVLEAVPGAEDVKVEQTTGLPMLSVKIDREKAGRLGLNVGDIQDTLATALGGREAGAVFEGGSPVRHPGAPARKPAQRPGRFGAVAHSSSRQRRG